MFMKKKKTGKKNLWQNEPDLMKEKTNRLAWKQGRIKNVLDHLTEEWMDRRMN